MKQLIFMLIALFGFAITSSAQQTVTKKTEKATKEVKTTTKAVLKKDGTVDKRYKEVKTNVVLKKDGTPDKRYKEAKTEVVLKKDGTPDKRYTKKK
jgi:LAS superfamily LD-carboxypeptidase LdcB